MLRSSRLSPSVAPERVRLDRAELPQQAEFIHVCPAFHDLIADDAIYVGSRQPDFPAGCRDTLELPSMRPAGGPAGHHGVAFGNLVLDGEAEVRESRTERGDVLLGSFAPVNLLGRGVDD